MDLAEQIDNIQGNDVWRTEPSCPLYESDRISSRIDEFVHLMRRRDAFDLMFTLRGGIARNKFGLLHEGLFSKALAGTKVLVETYHNVICASLNFICHAPPITPNYEETIPTDVKLAFFNETRHSYGRTALLLSGGAALGFYHVGVVKALMENGLLPRVSKRHTHTENLFQIRFYHDGLHHLLFTKPQLLNRFSFVFHLSMYTLNLLSSGDRRLICRFSYVCHARDQD